jgi:hypothetical protein
MHRNDTVTTSEIAAYVYCPEQWRLSAIGHESANQLQLETGKEHHAQKASAERTAGGAIAFGFGLIALAALALTVLWWLQR